MSAVKPYDRMDAAESVFFSRQMESIDARVYREPLADLKGRSMLPLITGVHPDLPVYTYRGFEFIGARGNSTQAAPTPLASGADDLKRVDVLGSEASQVIKTYGKAYGYDLEEIRIAAALGMDLDGEKALAARRACEEDLDYLLALGDTTVGLTGMLKIASGTTSFTAGTKQRGGTSWGSLTAPNATGEEIAADIMGICVKLHETTKEAFNRFRVILPTTSYNLAMTTRMGDGSNLSALAYAKAQCEYVSEVVSWNRAETAGSGSSKRMMAYPVDSRVLGALIPRDFTLEPVQQRNRAYIRNATFRTGGVVCRYPVAVAYGDNL